MPLRELLAVFGIKVDDKEVKEADKKVSKFTEKLKTFATVATGIFVARGIARMIDGVRATGDELDKTSQQLGVSIQDLQSWRFAAGLAGVEGTAFSQSLGILQKNAFEANRGTAAMAEAFQKLGVSVKDSNGELKDGDTLLQDVGVGLFNLDNESEKVALSLTLMGRTGKKLLPLFSQGAKGIALAREEFEALGGGLSKETIAASVELTDEQLRLDTALQGIRSRIALAVLPTLNRFVRLMTKAAAAMGNFLEGTHLVELGMVALGIASVVLGRKMIATAIKTLIAWAPMIAMFLLVTVLVGLVILAVDDLLSFLSGGESVIGDFIDALFGIGTAKSVVNELQFAWEGLFKVIDDVTTAVGDFIAFNKDAANFAADLLGFESPFAEASLKERLKSRAGPTAADLLNQARQAQVQREALAGRIVTRKGVSREQAIEQANVIRRKFGKQPALRQDAQGRIVQRRRRAPAPLQQSVNLPVAGARSNSVTQSSTNTVNIDARGADAREIESRVRKVLRRLKDDDNTAALEALVPQGSGG